MLALMLGASLVGWAWLSAPALAQTGATPLAPEAEAGKQLYMDRCQHCHGENGDGNGASAAVVYPKPRDFTSGIYKIRSAAKGANSCANLARGESSRTPAITRSRWRKVSNALPRRRFSGL